jgi:hypothetical protein
MQSIQTTIKMESIKYFVMHLICLTPKYFKQNNFIRKLVTFTITEKKSAKLFEAGAGNIELWRLQFQF